MRIFSFLAIFALSLTAAQAQQMPDREADLSVAAPAFARDKGPAVVVDAAHYNFHTIDNRYAPFADLLRNDGFRVSGSTGKFSAETLKSVGILVISNALGEQNATNWSVPVQPAFAADEVAAVRAWVEEGDSLLLIADHFPMAGAAADLAAAFGFTMHNGYASRMKAGGPDVFTLDNGSLKDDPILHGRRASETVRRIATFGGSAFDIPRAARPIIVLPTGFVVLFPEQAGQFLPTTPRRAAAGLSQGAVMEVGKGRFALFGEAAMFSAQRIVNGPPGAPAVMGFNDPAASENKQFILNLVRWLARV